MKAKLIAGLLVEQMYCEKIIASAASAANVSFEEMIEHVITYHELMGEVSKEKTTTKNKEAKNED